MIGGGAIFFEMRSRHLERSLFPCHLTKKPWNTYFEASIVFLPAAEAQRASPGLLGITRECSFELIYKVDSACRLHRAKQEKETVLEDTSQSPIEILHNGNTRVYAMETKSALTSVVRIQYRAKYFGVHRLPELLFYAQWWFRIIADCKLGKSDFFFFFNKKITLFLY